MGKFLFLIMISWHACAATQTVCYEPDVRLDRFESANRSREALKLFPVMDKANLLDEEVQEACDRAIRESQQAEREQEKDLFFQSYQAPYLNSHFLPEVAVSERINDFLDTRKFPQCDKKDLQNVSLRLWLSRFFAEQSQGQRDMITYPFLIVCETEVQIRFRPYAYVDEIQKVMHRLYGVFAWEVRQSLPSSNAMPGWDEEEKYPNMKKILRVWQQGPFPQSFCGNLMFLMQNRARLECFGCDMQFLDQCFKSIPAFLNPYMPGNLKYEDFYKEVFFDNPEIYKESIVTFIRSAKGQSKQDYDYMLSYVKPLELLEKFHEKMSKKPAARWLFELAEDLMVAEIILGKRPKLTLSIQGIAAYLNDQLEYVQFHRDYVGMNTDTLNALVTRITGGKNDLMFRDHAIVALGVLEPLCAKMYGFKRGIHPCVAKKGWVSTTHHTQGTKTLRQKSVSHEDKRDFVLSAKKVVIPLGPGDLEMESAF